MSTYASLTQDIQDWAEDDDSEFTAEIDNFITFAESRLFRDAPFLPIFKSTDTGTMSTSNESITLASTTRTIRAMTITISSSEVPLYQRTDSFLRDFAPTPGDTGQPKFYNRNSETTVIVAPVPDSDYAYTLLVTKQPTGLSSGNTTTWLSVNVPDILLFACMVRAMGFTKNHVKRAEWNEQYLEGLSSLQNEMGRNMSNEDTTGA